MPLELEAVVVGLEASIQRAMNIAGKNAKIDLGASSKAIDSLSQPLGRITGQADQFGKSMEAANARVLAFGASVGIMTAVANGFKEMISTTIQVEKSLADINSVLGANSTQLNKFKNDIFSVAKETGNSFQTVSDAALELSRQGLKGDEVLRRLKDSMVLTRLSGMDASGAVEGLTAAVNSFSKSGVTTTEVLNKIAKTAAGYAVSEKDLIEGFKRSASVAQQAGVSLDELGGIITAVQEKTARGGAVIGNAFKTIFTRIQRPQSLEALQEVGAAVTDMQGGVLPAVKLIENLAQKMNSLNDIQKANITEKIGGGFQIGPLLAALDDLTSKTSVFKGATEAMASAGNEAYARNTALNKTLAASINESTINLQELANTLGEIGVTDSLKNILSFFSSLTTNIKDLLQGEGIGSDLAKGIVKGLSGIITGPGFVIFGAIIAKLTYGLVTFGTESLKAFFGIGQAQKEINALASSLTNTLMTNSNIHKAVLSLEGDHVAQATLLGTILKNNNAEMQRFVEMGARLAPGVASVVKGGGRSAAGGYMPAVAQENSDIQRGIGGASPSNRPVVIPNFAFGGGKVGTMVANDGEYVVNNYGGSGGSAIFNKDMVSRIGLPSGAQKINSARGFIPNFADEVQPSQYYLRRMARRETMAAKAVEGDKRITLDASKFGFLIPNIKYSENISELAGSFKKGSATIPYLLSNLKIRGPLVPDAVHQAASPQDEKLQENITNSVISNSTSFARLLNPLRNSAVSQSEVAAKLKENKGSFGAIQAAVGSGFESAVMAALNITTANEKKGGDFDIRNADSHINTLFGLNKNVNLMDFKASSSKTGIDSFAKKIYNEIPNAISEKAGRAASGYIPNFADYIYDSDKLPAELRASILPAILASKKRKDGILGPAGSGKSTMAGAIGQFIQSMEDVAKATGFTILSASGMAKTPTGISKQFQPILDSIKRSGGSLKYLNVADAEIKRRRESRIATGSNDLRSEAQLKNSSFAPLNQPEFLDILKKEMGGSLQIINGARGYVPNFADPLKEAISREVGAGLNSSQVYVDQNNTLKNSDNPMGLMVANRRDEPAGGWQGINRARKEGADITAYGAARGFIPNYADTRDPVTGRFTKASKENVDPAADKASKSLDKLSNSADKTDKGQMDHLGTIFAVQLAMSGLSAGFADATSGAGLFAKRLSDSGSSITTAIFAMQSLQKIGTEGSKLSGVMGKLGTVGAVAAVAFEGFNLIRNVARDWSGATDQANKSTAAFKDQVDKAGVSLSSLSNLEQLSRKKTAKDLIYNIQDKTPFAVGGKEFQGQMADFQYLSGLTGSDQATQDKIKEILKKGGALDEYPSGSDVQTRINEDQAPEAMAAYLRSAEGQKEINRLKEEGKKKTEETNIAVEKGRAIEQLNFDIVKNKIKSELEIATLKARQKDSIDRQLSSAQILGNVSEDQIRSLEKQAALRDQDRSTSDEIKGVLLSQLDSSKALFADTEKFKVIKETILGLSTDELLNDGLRNELLKNFSSLNDEVTNRTVEKNKGEIEALKVINDLKKLGLTTSLNQKQADFDSLKIMKDAVSAAQELVAKKSFQIDYDAQSAIYAKDARKSEIDRTLAAGNLSESTIRKLNAEKARLDAEKTSLGVTQSQSNLLKKAKDQLLGTKASQGVGSVSIYQQATKSNSVEDVVTQLRNPMLALNYDEAKKRSELANSLEREKQSLDQSSAANIAAAKAAADLAGILPGVNSAITQRENAFSPTAIQQGAENAKFAAMTETSGKKLAELKYIQETAAMQDGESDKEAAQIAKDRSVKGIGEKFKESSFNETEVDRYNRFSDSLVSGAEKFRDTMIDGMTKAIEDGSNLTDILRGAALDFAREMTKANLKNMFSSISNGATSLFGGMATGGKVAGGSGTKDDVPTMLMGGEFVINKNSVSKYGPDFLNQLNKGTLQHFASGGQVQNRYAIQSGGLGSNTIGTYSSLGDVPSQSGNGGFDMPGYYGKGQIIGKENLMAYASQAYTSGGNDRISSGTNFGAINLGGESVRLTNFGRSQGPLAQAIRQSKEQASGLAFQQMEAEAQAKAQAKAQKKALMDSLKMMAITAAVTTVGRAAIKGIQAGGLSGVWSGGNINGQNVGGLKNLFTGNFGMSQIGNAEELGMYNLKQSLSTPEGLANFQKVLNIGGVANGSNTSRMDLDSSIESQKAMNFVPGLPTGFNAENSPMVLPSKRATGGSIPQTSGIDTVPTMLSGGEFVMNSAATQRIGPANLNSMNSGVDTSAKDSSAINEKLLLKLDELIKTTKDNKPVTVNVSSSDTKGSSDDKSTSSNDSQQNSGLAAKIRAAVIQVLQDEKRLGGVLRRS